MYSLSSWFNMLMFVYLFKSIVLTLRSKCRWNANNFHSHDVKSVLLRILYFLFLSLATLSIKLFFFLVHRKNYSLILNYKAKSCLFPLVAACTSSEYLNGFSGFFSTPNFPSNYPQYSKCTWNITVPSGYIIKLSFLYFRLEPHQYFPCYNNPEARVTVTNVASDDGYQPFMLCGQSLPPPVYSVGNSVQVIFTSLSSQYPGFNASYTAITYSSGTWYTLFITHQRLS